MHAMPYRKPILLAAAAGLFLPVAAQAELDVAGVEGELERNVRAFVAIDD